jgi:hypothetical protein
MGLGDKTDGTVSLMSSLLFYYVENSKEKENKSWNE